MVEELMIQKIEDNHKKIDALVNSGQYDNSEHIGAYSLELGQEKSSPDAPVIFGNFTNWHPKKMIPLEVFCEIIEQYPPDFIGKLISDDLCRSSVSDIDDLNE